MDIKTRDIAAMGVFTSFVAVATMSISLYVPATRGYFNIGETMVYTTALLMGPIIGGFAGGVGSMLADISLGYNVFAPGTLVIKGLEGFIVGYIAKYGLGSYSKKNIGITSLITGAVLALILWLGGISNFVGEIGVTLGIEPQTINLSMNIPSYFWILVSITSFIIVISTAKYFDPQINLIIYAVLIGGSEMVIGYYLYERIILGQALALTEVPINVGQVIIGLIIAIPLSRSIQRLLPFSSKSKDVFVDNDKIE
jgi:uncharacterized membrane protein